MFYLSSLSKELCISPKNINKDMTITLSEEIKKIEGKIMGNIGYIICITEFNQVSDGKVDNETGKILIKVNFKAITFKLDIEEILYAIPFSINEHGFFSKAGHCKIFTSKHMMDNYEYDIKGNIWKNKDHSICIDKLVKLKIIKVKINSEEITAMGILV